MKRSSVFLTFLLLWICAACQSIEVPSQEELPSTATPPRGTHTPTAIISPSEDLAGRITFYSHRDGNIEIYTMDPDGIDQRRLTYNEANEYSPAWSPDGSQVVYLSDRDDPISGECGHSCFYQLYLINVDDGAERRLIETAFSTLHPDWHPDGTRISFDTEANLQGDIYTVNPDGSNLKLLIEDGFWGDWSPDGTQIVFASQRDGNVELYLADAEGGNQRRLTQNSRLDYFPDWSPDGQRIAFTVMEDQAIYIIDADGSHEERLTYQGKSENPTWSLDGSWIAYQSSIDGDFEIFVVNVQEALRGIDSYNPIQITDNNVGDLWPSWGNAVP